MHVLHHSRQRRLGIKKNVFSARNAKWLDRVVLVVAVLNPIFVAPQAWAIWVNKQVSGISLVTWSGFLAFSIFWLGYGLIHREKPIIFSQALFVILNSLVVLGAVMYR